MELVYSCRRYAKFDRWHHRSPTSICKIPIYVPLWATERHLVHLHAGKGVAGMLGLAWKEDYII